MSKINLPPLFSACPVDADPFGAARAMAIAGCDAGVVTYHIGTDWLHAAIVFAPEVPLRKAMAILPICAVGFQNALGALAPPEVGVHLDWDGTLRLNGARCGRLIAASAHADPDVEPPWLVVGLNLRLWPAQEDTGQTPDDTALFAEGCAEVDVRTLLEAWVRHTLVWINQWQAEGSARIHTEWSALAYSLGKPIEINGLSGDVLGVDEHFGLLVRNATQTHIIPMTQLLET